MFASKINGGIRYTINFAEANMWASQGNFVSVHSDIEISHAGQKRVLIFQDYHTRISFEELRKYHPKWKIRSLGGLPDKRNELHSSPYNLYSWRTRERNDTPPPILEIVKKITDEEVVQAAVSKVKEHLSRAILSASQLGRVQRRAKVRKIRSKMKEIKKSGIVDTRIPIKHDPSKFLFLKEQFQKEGKSLEETILFHGTRIVNVEGIVKNGFRLPWHKGLLGVGIYVGGKGKATGFADHYVLECRVLLGSCFEVERLLDVDTLPPQWDSAHLGAGRKVAGLWGGQLRMDEWCCRRVEQILPIALVPT